MSILAAIGIALFCVAMALVALLPVIALVVAEEARDEERRRNSTGGRNYVE